jgi:hypothetical protein
LHGLLPLLQSHLLREDALGKEAERHVLKRTDTIPLRNIGDENVRVSEHEVHSSDRSGEIQIAVARYFTELIGKESFH